MRAYYNEVDHYAAQWLENLAGNRQIASGIVDRRDIRIVDGDDLDRFTQCHFFAGIGVWSYALRLAGWPDDWPIWTGSCPCQPFSGAGKRRGTEDERHLWSVWFDLIRKRRPGIILGEQVASPDGYAWFDDVQADMEGLGYACGAVVTPAAGYGAQHERHRIYWMAYALPARRTEGWSRTGDGQTAGMRSFSKLADACGSRRGPRRGTNANGADWTEQWRTVDASGGFSGLDHARASDTGRTIWNPSPNGGNAQLDRQVAHILLENPQPARLTATGEMQTGFFAGMANGGQLDPEHSRWLMGLPIAWANCAPTETPSSLRKRQNS